MLAMSITGHLASRGHGTLAIDLFTDDMPDTPDDVIVIYEYPGEKSVWTRDASDRPALERPRMQLSVRGTEYLTVAARAEAAHAELLKINNRTIDGVYYGHIQHLQDGWLKHRDDRNRHIWQRNYAVIREAIVHTV